VPDAVAEAHKYKVRAVVENAISGRMEAGNSHGVGYDGRIGEGYWQEENRLGEA
jgi:hypothetical protein